MQVMDFGWKALVAGFLASLQDDFRSFGLAKPSAMRLCAMSAKKISGGVILMPSSFVTCNSSIIAVRCVQDWTAARNPTEAGSSVRIRQKLTS